MKYLITYQDKDNERNIDFGTRVKGGIDLVTFDIAEDNVFMEFRSGHKITVLMENVKYLEIENKIYIKMKKGSK